ncbi:hypothetical protein Bca4012_103474 [Brassica carinata]
MAGLSPVTFRRLFGDFSVDHFAPKIKFSLVWSWPGFIRLPAALLITSRVVGKIDVSGAMSVLAYECREHISALVILTSLHNLCIVRQGEQAVCWDLGLAVIYECYLVDPASSHMLVSKIKPCMLQSKSLNEDPLEGKSGASSADFDPIVLAFGSERTTAKAFAKDVFINQKRKLGARRRSDTVLVSTISDADQGSADVAFRTPLAPYEIKVFGFGKRDLSLLTSYVEASLHGRLLRGTMAFRPRKFEAITESVNHRVFERKLRPKPSGEARLPGCHKSSSPILSRISDGSWSPCVTARLAKIELRMPGRLDMRCGGKETNKDSLSNGEREEPSLKIGRLGVGVVWKRPQRRTGPKFPGKGRQRGESPSCRTLSHHGAV